MCESAATFRRAWRSARIIAALALGVLGGLAGADFAPGPAVALASTAKGNSLHTRTNDGRRHFTLTADAFWHLNPPAGGRFDASGLAIREGKLLTVSDRGSELFEIELGSEHNATLRPTGLFSKAELARGSPSLASSGGRLDCEGIALDLAGNLYLCEEARRMVLRREARSGLVEKLAIDWTPAQKFLRGDANASFEGIALGQDRLYLANERDAARILVVDLRQLAVIDTFFVDSDRFALGGPNYTDLAFFHDHLFVLDRNHRVILEVEPATRRVRAEYQFGAMELSPGLAYKVELPTGTMEGLAVDEKYFWLVTDNNGQGRFQAPQDIRPTLFRVLRPSVAESQPATRQPQGHSEEGDKRETEPRRKRRGH